MWKKSLGPLLVVTGALLSIFACTLSGLSGSGDLITETREVGDFDTISLEGLGKVIVTQGAGESLIVETGENHIEHVEVEVKDGTLRLGFEDSFNPIIPPPLTFTVGVEELAGLSIAGSGTIEAESLEADSLELTTAGSANLQITDLTADELTVSIGGSGKIDLAGQAESQELSIGGSGRYQAGDLRSGSADVSIGGSGKATLWVIDSLTTDINGSGNVEYYGSPSVTASSSGSGDVKNLGEK